MKRMLQNIDDSLTLFIIEVCVCCYEICQAQCTAKELSSHKITTPIILGKLLWQFAPRAQSGSVLNIGPLRQKYVHANGGSDL